MIRHHSGTDASDSEILFGNNYQFSIRCGKCADIHNAQLEGKTTTPCECGCHETYTPYTQPCIPQFPPSPIYCSDVKITTSADSSESIVTPKWKLYTEAQIQKDFNEYCLNEKGKQADIEECEKRSGVTMSPVDWYKPLMMETVCRNFEATSKPDYKKERKC